MTNSRSRSSRSSRWAVLVLCVLVGATGVAGAERKRVVVLEIEGPKGNKFHDELEKLIKKTHTVVPNDKWYGTADDLGAAGSSEKNLKKVAKRLKIDAIVEGKVEKRRDDFILRLTLREGRSGEIVGDSIDTKADGPRIDGRAQRDLKDELVGAIDHVASNRLSVADDDEDDRPAKRSRDKRAEADDEADDPPKKPRGKKLAENDEADRPARKGKTAKRDDKKAKRAAADDEDDAPPPKKLAKKSADDEPPARKGKRAVADDEEAPRKVAKKADDDPPASKFSKHGDDERGSDRVDQPARDQPTRDKPTRDADRDEGARKASDGDGDDGDKPAAKQVAAADDDTSVEAAAEPVERFDAAAVSPASRAVDLVAGMSVTMRRLSFESRADLVNKPQGYRGGLVGGGMVDATIYPLALRARSSLLAGFGLHALYDRPLKVTTKDLSTGKTYDSTEQRFTGGVVFRFPFGHAATSPVVLASFEYTNQVFKIGGVVDNPDVKYSMLEPGLGLRVPIVAHLIFGLDGRLMLVRSTGQIQTVSQYGAAKVLGFEGAAGLDYLITHRIFARAAFRYETIGFTFKGTGDQALSRDGDAMTQDVKSARDNYLGGLVTLGYVY